jgi:WD domain, G-beta repeat.
MTVTGTSNLIFFLILFIYLFFQVGKLLHRVNDHGGSINDMQMSKDSTMFITASKDTTAKLFDTDSLMCLKTYKTERPVNSAAISPIFDHVSQFSIVI